MNPRQWATRLRPVGSQGVPMLPADHGLFGYTYPIEIASLSSLLSVLGAGILQGSRIRRLPACRITNLHVHVQVAGATLANCYAALYRADGTLVTQTTDQSTSWQTAGYKTMPITPYDHPGGDLQVGVWYGSGGTAPSILRSGSGTGTPATQGQSAGNYSAFSAGTGLTTSAPANVSGSTPQGSLFFWFGVS